MTAPLMVRLAVTQESRRISDAIAHGFALGAVVMLLSAFALIGLARSGGHHVRIRNWRFWLGVACLAAASVVGIVGYLQLSDEPRVNHQIPYLASAGMALVVLSVLGGALIVAEQMRADEQQLAEVEAAVEALAAAIAPVIEAPARRIGTSGADE